VENNENSGKPKLVSLQ